MADHLDAEDRRLFQRRRTRASLATLAAAVVVVVVAVGGRTLGDDHTASPSSGASSNAAELSSSAPDPTSAAPDPSPEGRTYRSGIVVHLPDGDVTMPPVDSCWDGDAPEDCRMGLMMPGEPGPDLGTHDVIDFQFAEPRWEFGATFRKADDSCARATTVDATRTGTRTFELGPAATPGRYEVELFGRGPGLASTRFFWTTTSDGPVDEPLGTVSLYANSSGPGRFGLEVDIDDLPFQPEPTDVSQAAEVVITGVDGTQHTVNAPVIPQSMDCRNAGYFYYQGEFDIPFSSLGGSPFVLDITMSIRGTSYVGQASWRKIKGDASWAPITFTPSLPGSG